MVRQSITKLSRCTSHQHGRRTWLRILRLRYVSVVEVGVFDNGMGPNQIGQLDTVIVRLFGRTALLPCANNWCGLCRRPAR
jgi:hypothetical protein